MDLTNTTTTQVDINSTILNSLTNATLSVADSDTFAASVLAAADTGDVAWADPDAARADVAANAATLTDAFTTEAAGANDAEEAATDAAAVRANSVAAEAAQAADTEAQADANAVALDNSNAGDAACAANLADVNKIESDSTNAYGLYVVNAEVVADAPSTDAAEVVADASDAAQVVADAIAANIALSEAQAEDAALAAAGAPNTEVAEVVDDASNADTLLCAQVHISTLQVEKYNSYFQNKLETCRSGAQDQDAYLTCNKQNENDLNKLVVLANNDNALRFTSADAYSHAFAALGLSFQCLDNANKNNTDFAQAFSDCQFNDLVSALSFETIV